MKKLIIALMLVGMITSCKKDDTTSCEYYFQRVEQLKSDQRLVIAAIKNNNVSLEAGQARLNTINKELIKIADKIQKEGC